MSNQHLNLNFPVLCGFHWAGVTQYGEIGVFCVHSTAQNEIIKIKMDWRNATVNVI